MIREINIQKTLNDYFCFDSFRKGQDEIIYNVLSRNNTLVVMPTGGGKSLCYQLPALHFEGTALVISPLIALMQDQVESLNKRNIPATFINSSLSFENVLDRIEKAKTGLYKLLFIAPERLANRSFIEALKSISISFLAVDEAHCISEWGHDFRPSYMMISEALKFFDNLPIIALTATATPEVQDDIVKSLKMKDCNRFVRGFNRPNLCYFSERIEDKTNRIIDICKETKIGSTIIYCGSRKNVEMITGKLIECGLNAISYHAGMPDKFREYAQDKFLNGEGKIIVATSAFGMGIDKPDVRNVIHFDMPSTLEAYYQEAGRAGRDGNPSKCIYLYHPNDRKLPEFFIKSTYPSLQIIESVYNVLYDINGTTVGSKVYDPVFLSDTEIGNKINLPSITVHSVINLLERYKIIKRGSTQGLASIKFTTSRERILEYYNNIDKRNQKVLEALLRGVGSEVFDNLVEFDIQHFMRKYDINIDELKNAVRKFEFSRILYFNFPGFSNGLTLLTERMDIKNLPIDFDAFEKRRNNAIKKLNFVQQYAETIECKRNFILNYFRDTEVDGNCGKCSSCLSITKKSNVINSKMEFLENKIMSAVYELNGSFGKSTIIYYLTGNKNESIIKHKLTKGFFYNTCKEFKYDDIKQVIDRLIFQDKIIVSNDQYSTLMISDKIYNRFNGIKQFQFSQTGNSYDLELFSKLKELRKEISITNKVVERGIISDSTLRRLTASLPKNTSQMQLIDGVGPIFINNFAIYFIEEIKKYLQLKTPKLPDVKLSELTLSIIELINRDHSLEFISKTFHISTTEIARLIQIAIEAGYQVRIENLISTELINEVQNLLNDKPGLTLKDIRSGSQISADYAELRIALAVARINLAKKK